MEHDHGRRLDDVDLFRGLCIVQMVFVHAAITFPPFWHGVTMGFDVVAEGFVLLSGFMVGHHYLPAFTARPWRTSGHIWKRAFQILLVQYALAAYAGIHLWLYRGESYQGGIAAFVADTLRWQNQGYLTDILPMFVVMLGVSPVFLWLASKGWHLVIALVSLGLFVLGLYHPWCLSVRPQAAFPVILWQVFFVMGAYLGVARYRGFALAAPRRPWRAVFLSFLLWNALLWLPWVLLLGFGAMPFTGALDPGKWPLKAGRVIFRLAELQCIYYLLYATARSLPRLPLLRDVTVMGRHSLFAFSAHVVLMYWYGDLCFGNLLLAPYTPLVALVFALVLVAVVRAYQRYHRPWRGAPPG